MFIFHWSGWRRFALDFVVLQLGLALVGLSVAMTLQVRSTLGEIPRGVIEFRVANLLEGSSTGEGIMVAMLGIAVVSALVAVAIGESFGWASVSISYSSPPPPPAVLEKFSRSAKADSVARRVCLATTR